MSEPCVVKTDLEPDEESPWRNTGSSVRYEGKNWNGRACGRCGCHYGTLFVEGPDVISQCQRCQRIERVTNG